MTEAQKRLKKFKEENYGREKQLVGNVLGHTYVEKARNGDTLFRLLFSDDYQNVNIGLLIEDEAEKSGRVIVRIEDEYTGKVEYFDIKNHNQYRDLTIREVSKGNRLTIEIETPEAIRGIWITIAGNARI